MQNKMLNKTSYCVIKHLYNIHHSHYSATFLGNYKYSVLFIVKINTILSSRWVYAQNLKTIYTRNIL